MIKRSISLTQYNNFRQYETFNICFYIFSLGRAMRNFQQHWKLPVYLQLKLIHNWILILRNSIRKLIDIQENRIELVLKYVGLYSSQICSRFVVFISIFCIYYICKTVRFNTVNFPHNFKIQPTVTNTHTHTEIMIFSYI